MYNYYNNYYIIIIIWHSCEKRATKITFAEKFGSCWKGRGWSSRRWRVRVHSKRQLSQNCVRHTPAPSEARRLRRQQQTLTHSDRCCWQKRWLHLVANRNPHLHSAVARRNGQNHSCPDWSYPSEKRSADARAGREALSCMCKKLCATSVHSDFTTFSSLHTFFFLGWFCYLWLVNPVLEKSRHRASLLPPEKCALSGTEPGGSKNMDHLAVPKDRAQKG